MGWLVLAVMLLVAVPVTGRTIDYSLLDHQRFVEDAARLKIAPISRAPERPAASLVLEMANGLNHETLALGVACAVGVENQIGRLLKGLVVEAGPALDLQRPPIIISVLQARSWRRCIELSELNTRCITRVILNGAVNDPDGNPRPVRISVERDASVGGFCESVAQGVGVISREAALQFFQAAMAAASATSSTVSPAAD